MSKEHSNVIPKSSDTCNEIYVDIECDDPKEWGNPQRKHSITVLHNGEIMTMQVGDTTLKEIQRVTRKLKRQAAIHRWLERWEWTLWLAACVLILGTFCYFNGGLP